MRWDTLAGYRQNSVLKTSCVLWSYLESTWLSHISLEAVLMRCANPVLFWKWRGTLFHCVPKTKQCRLSFDIQTEVWAKTPDSNRRSAEKCLEHFVFYTGSFVTLVMHTLMVMTDWALTPYLGLLRLWWEHALIIILCAFVHKHFWHSNSSTHKVGIVV